VTAELVTLGHLLTGPDIGIREIRMAESMDDFLDLYNEIQKDPSILNMQKGGSKGG
jgi:hypothetical protein